MDFHGICFGYTPFGACRINRYVMLAKMRVIINSWVIMFDTKSERRQGVQAGEVQGSLHRFPWYILRVHVAEQGWHVPEARVYDGLMAQQFMITLVLPGITYSLILQAPKWRVPEADAMEVHASRLELLWPELVSIF